MIQPWKSDLSLSGFGYDAESYRFSPERATPPITGCSPGSKERPVPVV